MSKDYTKVIIIGAPRSGTNMLRDVLTLVPGVDTWPCDEINYIWRHGNRNCASDELTVKNASPRVIEYINSEFDRIRMKYNSDVVVEKTCANSLRVDFVNKVLPDAKYIFIVRDGIDVIGSAKKRWKAKLNIKYIIEKVRFVPKFDLPFYLFRYLWSRLYKTFSNEKRLSFWGPIFKDMPEIAKSHSLDEVCALQWQRCVDLSDTAFDNIPSDRVYRVRYDDFVKRPADQLLSIFEFIGKEIDEEAINKLVFGISARSLGKGRNEFSENDIKHLE
jgi:hypothetical protein